MADWQTDARRAAQRAGIDPDLFAALVYQESRGNPNAVSKAGAVGYTQLMPGTARGLGVDPRDPAQNLAGGAKYLRQQLDRFGGDVRLALAAYNAGPGNVQKYGGIPPFAETQAYVKSVLGGVGGARGSGSDSSGSPEARSPTASVGAAPSVDANALLDLLGPRQRQAPPSTGNLPTPRALTGPVMPDGRPTLNAGQAPARDRPDVGALVAQVKAAQQTPGPTPSLSSAAAPQTAATEQAGAEAGLGGIVSEMDRIDAAKVPYLWGGGHQAKAKPGSKVTPLDCSGAVSQALGINPLVSGQFAKWGEAGRGKQVTIYANDEHVLMHVKGRGFWGTSKTNPGGGAGWIPSSAVSKEYLSRFTARHPPGL